MEQIKKENYNAVDIAKFIAAILVVTIHVNPLQGYNYTYNFLLTDILARLAVPFFFSSSAFFLFSKNDNTEFYIVKKYVLRLLKMYIIWSIIYTPIIIYYNYDNGYSFLYDLIRYIRNVLFIGTYTQLWYLHGLIIGILIIYKLDCFFNNNTRKLLLSVIILYVLGIFGQSYYGLIGEIPILSDAYGFLFVIFSRNATRNGIFFAPIFIFIGIYLARNKTVVKYPFLCFIVSFIFLAGEIYLLESQVLVETRNMYFLLIPCIYFLFYWLLGINLKESPLYVWLREYSTLIYLSHMIFLFVSEVMFNNSESNMYKFIFTIISSLGFAILYKIIQKKYNIKIFKHLI